MLTIWRNICLYQRSLYIRSFIIQLSGLFLKDGLKRFNFFLNDILKPSNQIEMFKSIENLRFEISDQVKSKIFQFFGRTIWGNYALSDQKIRDRSIKSFIFNVLVLKAFRKPNYRDCLVFILRNGSMLCGTSSSSLSYGKRVFFNQLVPRLVLYK